MPLQGSHHATGPGSVVSSVSSFPWEKLPGGENEGKLKIGGQIKLG